MDGFCLTFQESPAIIDGVFGGMSELAKEPVSKTGTAERPSGFESPSLRQGS